MGRTVVLRLAGAGTEDSLRAWVAALARVEATRRILRMSTPADAPAGLDAWCERANVVLSHDDADSPDPGADTTVTVHASAVDLPSPNALRRLVAATEAAHEPRAARVLPFGATAASVGGEPTPAPPTCVAFVGTDQRLAPTSVERCDVAAVFTDRRYDDASAPAPAPHGPPPPHGHPAAMPATSLHQLLLRAGVSPPSLAATQEQRPFLTVVTRTRGTRLLLLEEVLTCLAAQTSRDFEVVLACHRVAADDLPAVRDVVAATPGWMQERIRLLQVERPGRAAPLNDALDAARGRYVVVLDDDDAVTDRWVAAFAELERRAPGTVLRTAALRQDVEPRPFAGPDDQADVAPHETGPAHPGWPRDFSLVDHLWDNASPFMTVAFPRGVVADLAHRFDESLEATEDWDYLMRAAGLVGVTASPALTSVYRTWTGGEGSRTLHEAEVWDRARASVLETLDAEPMLLAPGDARAIRDLRGALDQETNEKFRFAALNEQAAADLVTVNEAVVALRARIAELEERLARKRRRRQNG